MYTSTNHDNMRIYIYNERIRNNTLGHQRHSQFVFNDFKNKICFHFREIFNGRVGFRGFDAIVGRDALKIRPRPLP